MGDIGKYLQEQRKLFNQQRAKSISREQREMQRQAILEQYDPIKQELAEKLGANLFNETHETEDSTEGQYIVSSAKNVDSNSDNGRKQPQRKNNLPSALDWVLRHVEGQIAKTLMPGLIGDLGQAFVLNTPIDLQRWWARNATDQWGVMKNKAEINEAQGEVVRAREKQQLLNAVKQFYENNQQLAIIQNELQNGNVQDKKVLDDLYSDMNDLVARNQQLLPLVKSASTYSYNDDNNLVMYSPFVAPKLNTSSTAENIKQAISLFENTPWGSKNNVSENLARIQSNFSDFTERKQKYDTWVDKTLIPAKKESVETDYKDLEKYNVDPVFAQKAEEAQRNMSFRNLDTYLYGLPSVLGSSASNNGIQYFSQALKTVAAGMALFPATAPWSIPVMAVGALAGVVSGEKENNAEVASNYMDAFYTKLQKPMPNSTKTYYQEFMDQISSGEKNKLSPEDAFNRFVFNPQLIKNEEIKRIAAGTLMGSNNLFENDMVAVVGSEMLDTSIGLLVPLGGKMMSSITKPGWSFAAKRGLVNFSQRHPELGNVAEYIARTAGNVTPGTPASVALELGTGAVKAGVKQGTKKTFNKIGSDLAKRIMFRSKQIVENPSGVVAKNILTKRAAQSLWAQMGMGFSEAIEEGKQHMHGESFKAGEYAGDKQGFFDLLADDMASEARGAYAFLGQFVGLKSDLSLIAEMNGGFLAPLGNASVVVNTASRFGDITNEISANNLVANQVMAQKVDDRLTIQSGIQFAKAAQNGKSYQYVDKAFQRMKDIAAKAQNDLGEEYDGFTVDDVEEQRQIFKKTYALATNPKVIASAKKRGIDPQSDDYATFVSLIQYGNKLRKDAVDKVSNQQEQIDQVANNLVVSDGEFQSLQFAPIDMLQEIVSNRGLNVTLSQPTYNEFTEDNINTDSENPSQGVASNALAQYRQDIVREVEQQRINLRNLAYLSALYKRIEALEQLENRSDDQSKQLGFFRKLLIEAKAKAGIIGVNSYDDLQELIDPRYSDDVADLSSLYSQRLLNEADVKAAEDFLHTLGGSIDILSGMFSDSELASVLKNISKMSAESDAAIKKNAKARAKAILDQYKKSVKEDEQYFQYIHDEFERQKEEFRAKQQELNNAAQEQPVDVETKEQPVDAQQKIQTAQTDLAQINALHEYKQKVANGYVPSDAEAAWVDAFEKRMKEDGYEMPVKIGDDFDPNAGFTKVETVLDPRLSSKQTKVAAIKRPLIMKDGKIAQSGHIVVATGPDFKVDTTNPKRTEKELGKNKKKYAAPVTIVREKSKQELVVDALNKKAIDDSSITRTGQDYFVVENGKLVRIPRLHSIKDKMYDVNQELQQRRYEIQKQLTEAYDKDIDEFKILAEDLAKKYNDALAEKYGRDSVVYKNNVVNVEQYFHKDIISDRGILKSIANLVAYTTKQYKNKTIVNLNIADRSVIAGSIIDAIDRAVFNGENLIYDSSYGMPENVFNQYVADLKKQKAAYERDGYVCIAKSLIWRGDVIYKGKKYKIAGETDMILVDKDGNIKIVDFKTAKKSYAPEIRYKTAAGAYVKPSSIESIPDGAPVLIEYRALDDKSSGANFTAREDYMQQLSMYAQMISQDPLLQNSTVLGIELLPTNVRVKVGKDASGELNYAVFDSFVAIDQSTGIKEDDNVATVDYVKLRAPIQLELIKPELLLDNLNAIVAKVKEATDRLTASVKANESKITPIGRQQLEQLDQRRKDLGNRYKEFMADSYQRSNADTLHQLESDLQSYLNKIEETIVDLNNLEDPELPDAPEPPVVDESKRFRPEKYEATGQLQSEVYINWNDIDGNEKIGKKPKSYRDDLRRVSALPDFLDRAIFEINRNDWTRLRSSKYGYRDEYVHIRYTEKKPDGSTVDHLFEYVPISIPEDRQNNPLVQAIDSIIYNPANLNKKIFLTLKGRTNGEVQYGKEYRTVQEAFELTDDELSEVVNGTRKGTLGITEKGDVHMLSANPNSRGNILFSIPAGRPKLIDGITTFVKYMHYEEDGDDYFNHKVLVSLTPKRLQKSDIDLIIDCLQNWGKQRKIAVNGVELQSPLNNSQLLTLLVRFGSGSTDTNNRFVFRFGYNQNQVMDTHIVEFGGIREGEQITSIESYDLRIPARVEALKQQLSKISVHYNNEPVMLQNIASTTNGDKLFGLRKFFSTHESVNEIKFSDSLVFNRADLDPAGDGSYSGMPVATWMLKHGWMKTQYAGVEAPLIIFEGAVVQDDAQKNLEKQAAQNPEVVATTDVVTKPVSVDAPTTAEEYNAALQNSDDPFSLFKVQSDITSTPIDVVLAKKRIHKILGKDFPVSIFQDKFINNEFGVVGRMRITAIELSTLAEAGTEFHEAFHAVLEFLVGEKRRQKLYDHYRENYANGRQLTNKQVAEELADLYMDFRNGIDVYTTNPVLKFFKQAYRWVTSIARLKDRQIAQLFVETSLGLYSSDRTLFSRRVKNAYDDTSIKLFKERFNKDHLNFSLLDKGGKRIKLNNFANTNQFEDAVNHLLYNIILCTGIDAMANNISKLHTDLNSVKSVLKAKGRYNLLTAESLSDEEFDKLSPVQKRNALMMRELFEVWNEITHPKIVDILKSYGIRSRELKQQQRIEDLQGSNTSAVKDDIEGHSDEFWSHSRADDISTGIQYMLSTIPALRYATTADIQNGEIGSDGKPVTSLTKTQKDETVVKTTVVSKRNSLGIVSFLPFRQVYQTLLKTFYYVNDVEELDIRLTKAAVNDYMFDRIANVFHKLRFNSYVRYSGVYDQIPKVVVGGRLLDPAAYIVDINKPTPEELYPKFVTAAMDLTIGDKLIAKGQRIPNAMIVTNPDAESLVTQLFQAIKSQKLDFRFVFSNQYLDQNGEAVPGKYTYHSDSTNIEQAQKNFPHTWFDNLRSLIGSVLDEDSKQTTDVFIESKHTLQNILKTVTQVGNRIMKVGQNEYNFNTNEGFDAIMQLLVSTLNRLGITIDRSTINYMLMQQYPGAENIQNAFTQWASQRKLFGTFIDDDGVLDRLHTAVKRKDIGVFNKDIQINRKRNIEPSGSYIYSSNSFISELSLWYGRYRSASLEMRTIGPDNQEMFMYAQNHTASDLVDEFKRSSADKHGEIHGSQVVRDLIYQQDGSLNPVFYNSYVEQSSGHRKGSIIVKALTTPGYTDQNNIVLSTHSGMKSDQRSDGGRKYVDVTVREDWLDKATLLSEGCIIFPTLSDKSTWFYLRGFNLPGLRWKDGKLMTTNTNDLPGVGSVGTIWFDVQDSNPNTRTGFSENAQIDQLIEYAMCDLANAKFVQEQLKNGKIPTRKMVKNFHTGDKHGARLAFMIGIYDEGGNFISFNNNKRSPEKDIELAIEHFYSKPIEEQRLIMARTMQKRLEEELKHLEENGIIERVKGQEGKFSPLLGYRNKYLDADKIQQLKNLYRTKEIYTGEQFATLMSDGQLESLAILAYVNDVNVKSNISLQETQRMFTGMPHFFKWTYDEDSGQLLNMREDESKRYGGLGSTGENNRIDLPNIETEYTCAEIFDWEISSPFAETLKDAFLDNEFRQAYIDKKIIDLRNENNLTDKAERQAYKEAYDESLTVDQMKEYLGEQISKVIEHKAQREAESYEKEINVADGTAFITDKMAENLLRQRGVYTNDVQQAFKHLRRQRQDDDYLSDSKAYRIIHEALLSTQKYSAFGFRKEFGIPVHYYNKFALFPLFEGNSYGFTHDLYQKMNGANVDMVMFTSAVKVGSEGAQEFNPDTFRVDDDPSNERNFKIGEDGKKEWKPTVDSFSFNGHTYKQKYSFIRRQLNTDPREEEEMHMGTQAAKVALSSLRDNQTYTLDDGTEILGKDLKERIMNNINELAKRGDARIRGQFLNSDGTLNVEKFSSFIKSELMQRNADRNILDAIEVQYYYNENTGEPIEGSAHFRADLNAISNMQWIESIITSRINSEVIDITLPGNAYYQRSVFGMEGSPIHAINDEDIKEYQINDGKPLQMINSDGSMDAVISIDYFMHLIPETIRYNFTAARQWLIDSKIIGNTDDVHANTVAYRIPTQAPSSVHAIRFVDVLPIMRDTIVFPKEFTKITGSDFDIDKQYLSTLNYAVGDNGLGTSVMEDGSDKQVQNQVLNDYLTLLKQGGKLVKEGKIKYAKYINSLKRSVDNDTELIKGDDSSVLDRIESGRKKSVEQPMQYGSLSTQVNIKNSFITGKSGIAPFALNNNSQILTQLYNVSFAEQDDILDWMGMTSLGKYTDRDQNSILSWIGALINAHVDVAKDPYILRLNVNNYTWNLLNLLIRTGFGDDAFFFINQPIMKLLATEYQNMNGYIVDDPGLSVTKRIAENEKQILQNLYNGWEFDIGLKAMIVDSIDNQNYAAHIIALQNKEVINALFGIDENGKYTVAHTILEDIVTNQKALIDPNGGVTLENLSQEPMYEIKLSDEKTTKLSPREVQAYVFLAKLRFDKYASAMADLVNATKIDTKKQGINYNDQLEYRNKYVALRNSEMFDFHLKEMLDKSFIDTKTQLALDLLPDILGTQIMHYSNRFQEAISMIQNLLNHTADTKKAIVRHLTEYIKQKAMNRVMEDLDIDFKSMISGKNTLASRLIALKSKMLNNPQEYSDFVSNGIFTNALLDNLVKVQYQTPFGSDQYDIIGLDNINAVETEAKNQFIDDWLQLYESPDEELRTLARDLAIYAFMTSADSAGFTKFFKYVPLTIREDIGYVSYINAISTGFLANNIALHLDTNDPASDSFGLYDIDLIDVIRNAWRDNRMVPIWKHIKNTEFGLQDFILNRVTLTYSDLDEKGVVVDKNTPKIFLADRVTRSGGHFPQFLKIRRQTASKYDANPYILYEYVGQIQKQVGKRYITYPVYAITKQPGYEVLAGSSRYTFYENDRDDNYRQLFDSKYLGIRTKWFEEQVEKLASYIQSNPAPGNAYSLAQYVESGIETFEDDEYNMQLKNEIMMIRDAAVQRVKQQSTDNESSPSQPSQQEYVGNTSNQKINNAAQKHRGDWSRQEAENNPRILYVFTDNTDRDSGSGVIPADSWYSKKYGKGHHYPTATAAVVRGLANSRPISTMHYFYKIHRFTRPYNDRNSKALWHDSDIEEFKKVIREELEEIVREFNTGKYDTIMFPDGDGLFNTKISNITKERTPQLYQALADLLHEYGFDKLIPSDVTAQTSINTYAGTVSRQLTLWDNSDEFSDEEMKHCK